MHNESQTGWNLLDNIVEPVFLIHNCIKLGDEIINQLPDKLQPKNQYDWVQHMLYYNNKIHEYIVKNNSQIKYPCGPRYICKEHKLIACEACITNEGKYSTQLWNTEW